MNVVGENPPCGQQRDFGTIVILTPSTRGKNLALAQTRDSSVTAFPQNDRTDSIALYCFCNYSDKFLKNKVFSGTCEVLWISSGQWSISGYIFDTQPIAKCYRLK
jgi:hypothetical protein